RFAVTASPAVARQAQHLPVDCYSGRKRQKVFAYPASDPQQ
ncbi:hypothetical protein L917_04095, partial [Phytophthora nicotianae]